MYCIHVGSAATSSRLPFLSTVDADFIWIWIVLAAVLGLMAVVLLCASCGCVVFCVYVNRNMTRGESNVSCNV